MHMNCPSHDQVIELKQYFILVREKCESIISEKPRNVLTLFRGGVCKFAHPYLDVTKRKIWGVVGAPNFLTFNIIILDICCEKLACVGPPLQIL